MSFLIVFWDKSKIQISDSTAEKLKEAIGAEKIKTFEIGRNLYSVSAVEKIITKEDAYDTFPKEWDKLQTMKDEVLPKVLDIGEGKTLKLK